MRFWLLVFFGGLMFGAAVRAAQPQADFDLVIDTLKNSGTWAASPAHKFIYQPNVSQDWAPYRHGQWRYTDYGWTWQGADSDSWMTDHYGYWTKRDTVSGAWVWVPGGNWLPAAVEWLKSGNYLGWRASKLDRFSNPLEPEDIRYNNPSEWNFVPAEKIRGPLTVSDFASLEKTKELLADTQPVDHTFVAYREIDRPGPAPVILRAADGAAPPILTVSDLSTLDAAPNPKSGGNYYVYRPKFYQDEDGIFRRVDLFLRPQTREQQAAELSDLTKPKTDPKQQREALRKQEELLEKQRKHEQELYR